MSDLVIVAIVGTIGSIITSVIAAAAVMQTRQTHQLINSRMTELLRIAQQAARAEGVAAGEQSQRDRTAEAEHS
jgi:hypothetical protein